MTSTAHDSTAAARALRDQVREVHSSAYGWALTCCQRDAHEAEDVLQDAYAKVMGGRARFEGRSSFKTWLFGVIRRTAMERRRRNVRRRLKLREREHEEGTTEIEAPDDLASKKQRAVAVAGALSALPTRQREVLHLVFYEGLSVTEAASAMGVRVGTARVHYHRGKTQLMLVLEEKGIRP